ncbi:hypothetical protein [Providencia rettgeri]|uniref:phage tail fiber protein n=1 Tax=Providencia rettgeri TaxID=587 RepID=UPI00235DF71D|nr:hypothetical protein [Providencia rettgeri]
MYNIGTVTTTANSNKLVGTGTKWKENINGIQPQQVIQIVVGGIVYNSSIQSIESDTALTLNFPFHAAVKDAKYVILTTMVNSVSSAANYMVALNTSNMQARDVANAFMTLEGTVSMTAPDGTKVNLRTAKEMDKQLDGKFDKTGGVLSNHLSVIGRVYTRSNNTVDANEISIDAINASGNCINSKRGSNPATTHYLPKSTGTLMQVGDSGFGGRGTVYNTTTAELEELIKAPNTASQIFRNDGGASDLLYKYAATLLMGASATYALISVDNATGNVKAAAGLAANKPAINTLYGTANTTKDSNGNLKAASPIVKLFADDIELNDESEGVAMEHLDIGHYLIKGVVGFNADGAWGINNGFVIPQDHNGKNMVLIDYEVKPDGDIEVFVFHQQNADMPERFQNKRIKHFDEEGVPVYFENYEPCDVPESRWIDMRVEMPPNSLYNQKQAEAERLAKIEAERLAQEEVKRIAEEAERADQKVE